MIKRIQPIVTTPARRSRPASGRVPITSTVPQKRADAVAERLGIGRPQLRVLWLTAAVELEGRERDSARNPQNFG